MPRGTMNSYGIGFNPAMNFFRTPVPNMDKVASVCDGDCNHCSKLKECRRYWDTRIAGGKDLCYSKDIPNERAEEAIRVIRGFTR